ncbi:PadR family transcriptional regulator [Vibrio sp. CAIM 722]|uniref:PadR family transcriptional regulator n=1 Tax=Vibrio eleionomae TaxID=2653505 RepID=A0A7X4LMT5_9VIBR|nr:PadR family transcriptional regulator [Vibrio eleionomae]MZI94396.1 PadR family transcriptional regulator [Vibrio eleionomae]
MRVLKYAILGLLNRHAMTGYDITKEFNHDLAEFWHAKHSQIYTELKKLFEEGLVTYDITISGEVLEKKLYSITEPGKADLIEWLKDDAQIGKTAKDVFRVRMYFCDFIDMGTRIELLTSQRNQHQQRLNELNQTKQQYTARPDKYSHRFGDYMLLEGAIMREQGLIDWCERCIQYCQE